MSSVIIMIIINIKQYQCNQWLINENNENEIQCVK